MSEYNANNKPKPKPKYCIEPINIIFLNLFGTPSGYQYTMNDNMPFKHHSSQMNIIKATEINLTYKTVYLYLADFKCKRKRKYHLYMSS
jgi:hypothetical protein